VVVDDLCTMLVEDGVGVTADFWTDFAPPEPDTLFALYSTGGPPADGIMERAGPNIEYHHIQVQARAASRDTASTNIQAAYDALKIVLHRWVGGTRYLQLIPLQPPYRLAKDENGRWIYAFNVRAEKAA
jgi:hypothetical protein